MSPQLRSAPQATRRSASQMPYQSTTVASPGRDEVVGKASSISADSAVANPGGAGRHAATRAVRTGGGRWRRGQPPGR